MKNKIFAVALVMGLTACGGESATQGGKTEPAPKTESVGSVEQKKPEPVKINAEPVAVKKGAGKFTDVAKSLVAVQALREDPGNFYEKIKKCRKDDKGDECGPLLEQVEELMSLADSERPVHDLNLIIERIKFLMSVDEETLAIDTIIINDPVSQPKKRAPEKPGS